jgi:hypothetical protein
MAHILYHRMLICWTEDRSTKMRVSQAPEYQRLSKRAAQLLVREEGFDVDFKRSISGLEAEDIVAFANSKAGGAILIGVDESTGSTGRQVGIIVGCPVGDKEKRKILDKAHQCVPPINVTVHVENRADKPFYRVEIMSGPNKPYCTSGGSYKTRGDGRKNTLYPTSLLTLFLETEGGEFLRRFQQATSSLEQSVEHTKNRIISDLGDLASSVAEMEFNVDQSLERVAGTADSAEENAMNANAFSEEALHLIEQVYSLVENLGGPDPSTPPITQKLDAIIDHFKIENPAITAQRKSVKALIAALTARSTEVGRRLNRRSLTKMVQSFMKNTAPPVISAWVEEAMGDPTASKDDLQRLDPLERNLMLLAVFKLLPKRAEGKREHKLKRPPKAKRR